MTTRYGTIHISKSHVLSKSLGNFKITSFAQETMCRFGQSVVFEEASLLINSATGSNFNAKEIERVCHKYGAILESNQLAEIESGAMKEFINPSDKEELHYAMVDGAMYPTREKDEPWKEMKLGRIIKASDILPASEKRNFIDKSTYIAHLGEAKDFFPKFEHEIESIKNLVFVNDGGPWIWNFIESKFPDSIQILDYYHAKEHLCEFANYYIEDEKVRVKWIEQQSKSLLEKTPQDVIEEIKRLETKEKDESKKNQLINYYTKHLKRMHYKEYRDKGLIIGSGAIESAHRVYQQRFKLSGQHWSKTGLQQVMQLKSAFASNQWYKIEEIAKKAA